MLKKLISSRLNNNRIRLKEDFNGPNSITGNMECDSLKTNN